MNIEDEEQQQHGYRLLAATYTTDEDAAALGRIAHRAFLRFNRSVGIPPHIDSGGPPSVGASEEEEEENCSCFVALIKELLLSKSTYAVVAVCNDSDKFLGGAFLHYTGEGVHSIGPVFVDPNHSNHGVATAVVRRLRDHALKANAATSIRLSQGAHNTKSFCIYAKLGFNPVEAVSYFEGRVDKNKDAAACLELGLQTMHDVEVRPMQKADVPACAALFEKTMGYTRESDIRDALAFLPTNAWVAVKHGEEALMSFTTGFHLTGFSVSINEECFVMLFRHVSHEWHCTRQGPDPTMHMPSRLYPKLVHWAIRSGLRLIRHQWIMVYGEYQSPKHDFVYCPSILH